MKTTASPLLLALLVLAVGCFPVRQTVSPSVTGVVMDAKSRRPVVGAEAVIAYSRYPPPTAAEALTNTRPPTVFTKSDGGFHIPASDRRVWQSIFPVDCFYPSSTLLVRASGYVPAVVPVTTIGSQPTNVGEIFLIPQR